MSIFLCVRSHRGNTHLRIWGYIMQDAKHEDTRNEVHFATKLFMGTVKILSISQWSYYVVMWNQEHFVATVRQKIRRVRYMTALWNFLEVDPLAQALK